MNVGDEVEFLFNGSTYMARVDTADAGGVYPLFVTILEILDSGDYGDLRIGRGCWAKFSELTLVERDTLYDTIMAHT